MSNLSDLLPAGASGKTIEAVATATIASKAPVILNSAGTVTEISGSSDGIGTATAFTATSVYPNYINSSYDLNADKVVVFYTNGSTYLVAAVGTVSGTSISFGTPVVANSTGSTWLSSSYDSVAQKIVVGWSESGVGKAMVGTVSGTTISFGAETTFQASGVYHTNCVYDTNADRTVITYRDTADSNNGKAIVGTVSGTGISFGTAVTFDTVYVQFPNQVYDANAQKIAIVYQDATAGDGWSIVGTVSGTSISFGTAFRFTTDDLENHVGAYDSVAQKVVYSFRDLGNSSAGTTVVGTISGTSISFGTEVVFTSNGVTKVSTAFQVSAGKVAIAYQDSGDSDKGKVIGGTVSGTTISFGSNTTYNTGGMSGGNFITYNSVATKNVISWGSVATPTAYQGFGIVQQFGSSNLTATNFVGIADAGISTSATGTIVVQGGTVSMVADTTYTVTVAGAKFVIDGVSQATLNLYEGSTYTFDQAEGTNATHPLRLSASSDGTHGSPAAQVFTSESSLDTPCITYDTTNDKIVIAYRYWSGSANVGAVIVGTLSGNSITYGTPVVMPTSAVPTYTSITYDSNANRVVISYRDADNSDYGTSVVVTISGTTPSFGTPVVFESANSPYISSTYDSDANKVVIAYQDVGNSSYGTAIVGTVSGTSISFGTPDVFESAGTTYIAATFDDNSNKVVVAYKDEDNSGHGTVAVGTVSGTGISFGTPVVFQANSTNEEKITFDTTANKVVIAYQSTSNYGTAIVGTVSGTSMTFGAQNAFNSANSNNMGLAYDATADTTTIAFKQAATTGYGTKIVGTISGTSISFGSQVVFEAAATTQCHLVYDPDQAKIVISYLATTGKTIVYPVSEYTTGVTTNGTPGSAGAYTRIVVATGAPTLYYYCSNHSGYGGTANTPSFVTGSKYYVQDDGTITTVSSSVNAGLAISTTSLLLNGDS